MQSGLLMNYFLSCRWYRIFLLLFADLTWACAPRAGARARAAPTCRQAARVNVPAGARVYRTERGDKVPGWSTCLCVCLFVRLYVNEGSRAARANARVYVSSWKDKTGIKTDTTVREKEGKLIFCSVIGSVPRDRTSRLSAPERLLDPEWGQLK